MPDLTKNSVSLELINGKRWTSQGRLDAASNIDLLYTGNHLGSLQEELFLPGGAPSNAEQGRYSLATADEREWVQFHIVGFDQRFRGESTESAYRRQHVNVTFHNNVTYAEKIQLYQQARVCFVHNIVFAEGERLDTLLMLLHRAQSLQAMLANRTRPLGAQYVAVTNPSASGNSVSSLSYKHHPTADVVEQAAVASYLGSAIWTDVVDAVNGWDSGGGACSPGLAKRSCGRDRSGGKTSVPFSEKVRKVTLPQVKSRTFEAALNGCLMLVRPDRWNLIERYFEAGKMFVYVHSAEELMGIVRRARANFTHFQSIVNSAYQHAKTHYTKRGVEDMINQGE
eukprot:TRINITY_DN63298_c0_g1_i1.p1 TRINITY_DN63298_c0_g1~~TRINITY_DN63298_c0_g1_i1.p1  ORF type:complete len:371 (-),score=34.70 TRINITY_DN63298_c0_g1_i1:16-1035(-)